MGRHDKNIGRGLQLFLITKTFKLLLLLNLPCRIFLVVIHFNHFVVSSNPT